jgi:uncharacterized protein YndB with AHSA1/START domain
MSTMTDTDAQPAATRTTQVYRVYIKAEPERVWAAITSPEWTDRYGYGGRIEFDRMEAGSPYRHYTSEAMRAMNAPDVAIDGEVVEVDEPRKLVMTWRMAMDDGLAAEGFTTLTYELEPRPGGLTRLTVVHDLTGAPRLQLLLSGGMEDEGAGGGWAWVLSDLKSLLESGSSLGGGGGPQ